MSLDVLNPALYGKLVRVFGEVTVANPGQAMRATPYVDPVTRRKKMEFSNAGEYYRVNCPFCGDRRKRLYVSHMYGQTDPFGRRMSYVAHCFDDRACMDDEVNAGSLREMLTFGMPLANARVKPGRLSPEGPDETAPPGPCTRLDRLPSGHPAVEYMRARKFDAARIGRAYGATYCTKSYYTLARERIVAPVVIGGKLKGWQCRYVGELPWKDPALKRDLPPKYFTCPVMKKSTVLYNHDAAVKYRTGVAVEGFFDVWGFGPMAVATFGASLSEYQAKLIARGFADRPFVLLYDGDAFERKKPTTPSPVEKATEHLTKYHRGGLAVVKLPKGLDPGKMPRPECRALVEKEALGQGVKVDWRPVA